MRIIIAECTVEYDGRAKSSLSHRERVILIKSDGTVLIHTDEKQSPVNYMPKSDRIEFFPSVKEYDTIVCTRNKPYEQITITIEHVLGDVDFPLDDSASLELVGSERNIQDYLYDNPDALEEGMKVIGREYPSQVGPLDLYCQDKDGVYCIVELKRVKANLSHVSQLKRYYDVFSKNIPNVRAILVADGIVPSAKRLLEEYGFSFVEVLSLGIDFDNLSTTKNYTQSLF